MDKDRCDEPPPLTLTNFGIRFHAERHQRRLIRRAACERHQEKDDDVDNEKHLRYRRSPRPDRVQEFEMLVGNHKRN